MTYEEVLDLGWIDRHDKKPEPNNTFYIQEEHGQWMMQTFFKPDKEGFHDVMIVWVDSSVTVNEWENSDPSFHGIVKTKDDLKNIMRYCAVIEY